MSYTLADALASVRTSGPHYGASVVPNRVLGDQAANIQRRLFLQLGRVNRHAVTHQFVIGFDLSSANLPGTVANASTGGLPVTEEAGVATVTEATAGGVLTLDLDTATVLVAGFVPASATMSTVVKTAAGWTVNAHAGKIAHVTDGIGAGPDSARLIASNTATTLTITGTWLVTPTTGSVVRVVDAPSSVADDMGVVTALPAFTNRVGYLARLDANGTAYIDYTKPIVTRVDQGVDLPPHSAILSGQVILTGTDSGSVSGGYPRPLRFVDPSLRSASYVGYAAYVRNNQVFLLGTTQGWNNVRNVVLDYIPIPPDFGSGADAMTTPFLLPDSSFDCVVQHLTVVAARWAKAAGKPVDVGAEVEDLARSEDVWLKAVPHENLRSKTTARIR